jgi:hypothetical protein
VLITVLPDEGPELLPADHDDVLELTGPVLTTVVPLLDGVHDVE